jgi:predicted secreted hydrolase
MLALLALALALAGCTARAESPAVSASVVEAMAAPSSAGYARAVEPRAFTFPREHGPHPEYRTEWWYYTGNLEDAQGTQYGYQLTFFRSALTPQAPERASGLAANQVYMAHFAVSDGGRREHVSFDRYSRGAGGLAGATGEPDYRVWLDDWSAQAVGPGTTRLQARVETEDGPLALDLTLSETRPPVLQGDRGLHQKGPEAGNASYYYSLVGLQTEGTLTLGGAPVAVSGQSWMDHEFGTSALTEGSLGWDWFSLQLDSGHALMLYVIRTEPGYTPPDVLGTLVYPDGTQVPVPGADFTIEATDTWTSDRTGFTYPVGWRVSLPGHDIELEVTPLFPDQEMDVEFVYWEGAVNAVGSVAGQPVTGRGYVELTGYGQETGEYQR